MKDDILATKNGLLILDRSGENSSLIHQSTIYLLSTIIKQY